MVVLRYVGVVAGGNHMQSVLAGACRLLPNPYSLGTPNITIIIPSYRFLFASMWPKAATMT